MTPVQHTKQRFEISPDTRTKVLTITLWGLWDVEEAETFQQALQEVILPLQQQAGEWRILMDITAYPDQLDDVQQIVDEGLNLVHASRVAMLARSPRPQFQYAAAAQGNGHRIYSYFSSRQDAVRWLVN